jgi:hypothetical protein
MWIGTTNSGKLGEFAALLAPLGIPLDSLSLDGKWLADEVLGDSQADWFIDTQKARLTALRVGRELSNFLATKDIVLYDLCLFIDAEGSTVFGEISQDCGRYRHFDLGSLDKDAWRAGGSSEHVLSKWQLLLDLIKS